ncbi:hypothetical protein EW146_g52 [Bondarzewia mesenterica]|uniref:Uncharacterized protein n=1 Tax=Bondarzewia mesenterica TaxID=1095465 RepID=A0A4S4MA41_9AGAM|nr:hypothetical protein EW146_g52 [Bondarzewia mesenterica]
MALLFSRLQFIFVPLDLGSLNAVASGVADSNFKPPFEREISLNYSSGLNHYFVIQRAWTQLNKALLLDTFKFLEAHARAYANLHTIIGLWEVMADFPNVEESVNGTVPALRDFRSIAGLPPRKRTKRTRQEVGRPSKKGRGE